VIGDILPPVVAVAEEFGDVPDVVLFPEEEAVIARAVDKRRREFTTARACARAALAELGLPPAPIVPGPRGAPQWPPGVVGSITHCAGYRASAVSWSRLVVTIGLDAEPHDKLPSGVLEAVSSADERERLAALTAERPDVCWDRMLFCVKETVYKAWFPLTRRWLGFEQASVEIDAARGTFTATLLVDGPEVNGAELTAFAGRWLVSNGLIATAIAVTAEPPKSLPPDYKRGVGPAICRKYAYQGRKNRPLEVPWCASQYGREPR
jgi:4'-phosphopantetheinyl transferase EntD